MAARRHRRVSAVRAARRRAAARVAGRDGGGARGGLARVPRDGRRRRTCAPTPSRACSHQSSTARTCATSCACTATASCWRSPTDDPEVPTFHPPDDEWARLQLVGPRGAGRPTSRPRPTGSRRSSTASMTTRGRAQSTRQALVSGTDAVYRFTVAGIACVRGARGAPPPPRRRRDDPGRRRAGVGSDLVLAGEKILVTGVTGKIGFPIARELAADNEVWGVARLARPRSSATG